MHRNVFLFISKDHIKITFSKGMYFKSMISYYTTWRYLHISKVVIIIILELKKSDIHTIKHEDKNIGN